MTFSHWLVGNGVASPANSTTAHPLAGAGAAAWCAIDIVATLACGWCVVVVASASVAPLLRFAEWTLDAPLEDYSSDSLLAHR